MNRTSFRGWRSVASVTVPLVVGATLAWHPPDPQRAEELTGMVGRWLTIHLVLLIGMPLLAVVVLRLLDGVPGRAAAAARLLVVPGAALYAAFDSLVGIGTGVLVSEAARLDLADQAGAAALAQVWWEVPPPIPVVAGVAIAAWTAALALAAVAARRGGLGAAPWALATSALLFALGHPGITGAASMAALAIAVVATERSRRHAVTGPEPAAAGTS